MALLLGTHHGANRLQKARTQDNSHLLNPVDGNKQAKAFPLGSTQGYFAAAYLDPTRINRALVTQAVIWGAQSIAGVPCHTVAFHATRIASLSTVALSVSYTLPAGF